MADRNDRIIPQQLTGDLRKGGWQLKALVESDTDALAYRDSIRVMGRSGADFLDSEPGEVFNGHVISEPDEMQVERFTSRVKIMAATVNDFLESGHLQAIAFTDQASPSNDHQVNGLDFAEMVDHIIRRHCNAVFDATEMPDGVVTSLDVDTANSTTIDRFNVPQSDNFWRSLQTLGGGDQSGEFYFCWFDRRNKFYYQPAPAFWSTPPTSKGTLTKDHIWSMKIRRNANQPKERIGQASITAHADFDTLYTASYPPNPGRGKILPPKKGVYAQSQARADTLAQRLYQWLTRTYTVTVEVDAGLALFGDDGQGLDLGDKVALTYDGPTEDADTGGGLHINWDARDFFIYNIKVDFDAAGKVGRAFLTLEQDPTY